MSNVKYWFDEYLSNFFKKIIINFDETGFRIKCMKKYEILVFSNVKKFYATDFENKKIFIILEFINAIGIIHFLQSYTF